VDVPIASTTSPRSRLPPSPITERSRSAGLRYSELLPCCAVHRRGRARPGFALRKDETGGGWGGVVELAERANLRCCWSCKCWAAGARSPGCSIWGRISSQCARVEPRSRRSTAKAARRSAARGYPAPVCGAISTARPRECRRRWHGARLHHGLASSGSIAGIIHASRGLVPWSRATEAWHSSRGAQSRYGRCRGSTRYRIRRRWRGATSSVLNTDAVISRRGRKSVGKPRRLLRAEAKGPGWGGSIGRLTLPPLGAIVLVPAP